MGDDGPPSPIVSHQAPAAAAPGQAGRAIDWGEVVRFLQLIGRPGATDGEIVFAVYPPGGKGTRHYNVPSLRTLPKEQKQIQDRLRAEPTHSLGVIINAPAPLPQSWGSLPEHYHWDGGPLKAWGAQNHHIARFVGGYSECDGGLPIDDQLALPARAGLPPPSLIIFTGGKSIHFYWLLRQGELLTDHKIARRLQKALAAAIEHVCPEAGVDKGISSASHVMRCPGGYHPKTGQSTRILVDDGPRYSAADLLNLTEWIEDKTGTKPQPPREPRPPAAPVEFTADASDRNPNAATWFERCGRLEQLGLAASMLQTIPPRGAAGSGTYNDALAAVAALAGHFGADGALHVIDLAGWDDPAAAADWDTADKVADLAASSRTGIGALIKAARARGWEHPHADQIEQAKAGQPSANGTAPPAVADPDDLPPAPTPERLAEIEQEIAALEHDAEAAEAAAPDRESVLLAIADLSVKWDEDPDQVEAIADTIGHYLAASEDWGQLIPLRDRLCAAAKGAPKKHLQEKIQHACINHRAALHSHGAQIAVLIAERDARQLAIQQRERQREQQHEQQAAAERKQRLLKQAAGMEPLKGLLSLLPSGWGSNEEGETTRTGLNGGAVAALVNEHAHGLVRFNDLTRRIEFYNKPINEDCGSTFYIKVQGHGYSVSSQHTTDGILDVAYDNRYHPVREYLDTVAAEGDINPVDLDTLATTYLGTKDQLYDKMLRKALIGAVARVYDPGCQFDFVCVLKGKQGIRKSSFWKVLASHPWFNCTTPDDDKDLILNIHSCWIFELGELETITSKREVGQLRNLITTATDNIRVPYGKTTAPYPRCSILVGSVNGDAFLRDDEGSRRFGVIECPQDFDRGEQIDLEAVHRDREAIWKAAVLAYRNGELPCLDHADQIESNRRNSRYEQEHPWTAQLDAWARRQGTEPFTTAEALAGADCRARDQIDRRHEMEAAAVLKKLGCPRERYPSRAAGGRARRWLAPAQPAQPGTTSEREVAPGQTAVVDSDPAPLAQPAQPFLVVEKGVTGGEKEPQLGGDVRVCGGASGTSAPEVVPPPLACPEPLSCNGAAPAQPQPPEVVPGGAIATGSQQPPEWLPVLQQVATAYPDDTAAELSDRLWSGYRIETTEQEVTRALAALPPATTNGRTAGHRPYPSVRVTTRKVRPSICRSPWGCCWLRLSCHRSGWRESGAPASWALMAACGQCGG
ncbi:VapE domain-containing protein [Synechococcus sp. CS-205]|uniref:VapE domain-containing protein n=1 Tax=Synechococcus sp. CS-205 TaxID=2847984 RepID=UPI00223C47A7|nr:VapE domain-containing protein [Synechococcus sp. CS-205]